jgi:hypothetical protein
MIPKNGIRFSEKIMPHETLGDEPDSAKLDQALDENPGSMTQGFLFHPVPD